MNVRSIEWKCPTYPSPQKCCAASLAQGRPFVVGLWNFGRPYVGTGDLIAFDKFFVAYPVIRIAEPSEVVDSNLTCDQYVVLAEPPETDGVGTRTVNQEALVAIGKE